MYEVILIIGDHCRDQIVQVQKVLTLPGVAVHLHEEATPIADTEATPLVLEDIQGEDEHPDHIPADDIM